MSAPRAEQSWPYPPRRAGLFVLVVVVVGYLWFWISALPLYLDPRHLAAPYAKVLIVVGMAGPTLGALLAHRLAPDGRRFRDRAGLRPGRIDRRLVGWAIQAALVPWLLAALSVLAAVALGLKLDLTHFSAFAAQLHAAAPGRPLPPLLPLVLAQLAGLPVGTLINAVPVSGEEIGWRGVLQPLLGRSHPVLGTLATGTLWGLWHAPVLLLGYNYPLVPAPLRLLLMIGFCIASSAVLGQLRRITGVVWVPVLAHASINAVAALPVLLAAYPQPDGTSINTVWVGLVGWPGWLLLLAWAALIKVVTARRSAPVGDPSPGAGRPPG